MIFSFANNLIILSHEYLFHECISFEILGNYDCNDEKPCCKHKQKRERFVIDKNTVSIAAAAFATNNPDNSHQTTSRYFTSREVKIVVISFGIRVLFTGLIWDHYVHKYHDLLMVFSNNPNKRVNFKIYFKDFENSQIKMHFNFCNKIKRMQGQAFRSIGMWLIMWFWRIGSACAILEHLVITTIFDNLWVKMVL